MKTLDDLKAEHLPRCDWRTLLRAENLSPEDETALDAHFKHFLPPGKCCMCGAQQGGDAISSALGLAKFTWGIQHGEGFCYFCKWPARAYHYDIGPIKKLVIILQYHPEECHE